jgi:hypothetical protein
LPGLAEIAGPENIVRRRAGAIVADHEARRAPEDKRIPKMARRHGRDLRR